MQKTIFVKVKPSQTQEEIIQQDNQNFIIRLKQKPEGGKANLALIKLLAKHFNISTLQIKIIKGKPSKNKLLKLNI